MFSKIRHAFITAHGCSISFAAHGSPGGGRPIILKPPSHRLFPHRIPIPQHPHYISLTEPLRLLNSVVSSHHRPCSSSHLPPYHTQIDLAACRAATSSSPLRTTAPRNPSPGLSSTEARRVEFLASQSSSAAASLASLLSSLVVLDLRGRAADPPELGLISSFAAGKDPLSLACTGCSFFIW
ncbi:hypothetical protein PVAP13_7KG260155 [Panicum virgatum]|uniref:Uncharacterized protein n=1 Tax=Panicum virgatum TaxID=38727 RepID=A0A8T0QJB6_PANVG|nr:hypothetical protein PVAP13_7KG260155 [Panicum virgatum]